jgi:isopenicillin N synthase-like dioxygenase
LISEALGVQSQILNDLFRKSVSTLRLIRYPKPQIETEQEQQGLDWAEERPVICSSHTDSGLITILYQDSVGGLQVLNGNGQWINAPPIPGSFVINLGDVLQFWSGGRYLATQHRVLGSASERMSIPFFFEPGYDASLGSFLDDQNEQTKQFTIDGKLVTEMLYKEYLQLKIQQFIEFK